MQVLLVSVKEAANALGISRSHLYEEFITPKRLPVVHIGRSVRIVLAELEALVDALAAEGGETDAR